MMQRLLPTKLAKAVSRGAPPAPRAGSSRGGITLLETLLAIALAGIILYFISTGVHLTLRLLEREREEIEEAHLARVLLEQMAADLRAAVFALPEVGSPVPGGSSAGSPSTPGNPGDGSNATGGPTSPSGQTSPGGPTSPSGQNPQSPTPAGGSAPGGQGSPAGGGPPGNSAPPDPPPEDGSADSEPSSGAALGLVGTRYALQIDILRPPRIDQYQPVYARSGSIQIPTGVRTVRYERRGAGGAGTLQNLEGGLYRWESDCQVARLAIARANWGLLESTIKNLAPEVTRMEFRYYDGFRWWVTWDSQLEQRLPLLVEITLQFGGGGEADRATGDDSDRRYRLLVRLPTATLPESTDSASGSDSGEGAA
jgi:type II secretory pathway pseudopilin PulG